MQKVFERAFLILLGWGIGVALTLHFTANDIQARTAAANASMDSATKENQKSIAEAQKVIETWRGRAETCQAGAAELVQRQQATAAFNGQWYVLLYEPATTAPTNNAARNLVANMIGMANPALGRILGSLEQAQSQQAGQSLELRWVIRKDNGLPVVVPPGFRSGIYRADEVAAMPSVIR